MGALRELFDRYIQGSPLRHPPFRAFYFGSVAVALGYTVQATVAAWLMATLTPSALMVALVQSATSAPGLLFGLAAGALADLMDRRRLILVTQFVLGAATLVLGVATLAGAISPAGLLLLTFLVGSGFTFYQPALMATTNDLVPRTELSKAVSLGAVAFNVARAAGPALAGLVVAVVGSGVAFLASTLGFAAMIVAQRGWRSPPAKRPGVPETLVGAVESGLRYVRHSQPLRSLLIRNVIFCACGSALWSLLPVVARDQLGLGAAGFGLIFGTFGAGAVLGALAIPQQLARLSLNRLVKLAGLLWVVATLLVAVSEHIAGALLGCFAAGAAWVSVLASLSAGTQSSVPAWVRARAVALSLLATTGSLAAGGVVWGTLASLAGTRVALAAAAFLLFGLHLLSRRVHVTMGEEADVTQAARLPDFSIAVEPMPTDGPVLVQVEYRIDAARSDEFLRALDAIGPTRRRNGATSWRVFRDLAEENLYVERYIVDSWAEYMRWRARMTQADRELQDRVSDFQVPGVPIRVSRLIGVETGE